MEDTVESTIEILLSARLADDYAHHSCTRVASSLPRIPRLGCLEALPDQAHVWDRTSKADTRDTSRSEAAEVLIGSPGRSFD